MKKLISVLLLSSLLTLCACSSEPTEPETPTDTAHVHSYTEQVVKATCISQGYVRHECACGDAYEDSFVAAGDHSYTEQVVPPTDCNGGYTVFTCTVCGAEYRDDYTEPQWWDDEKAIIEVCQTLTEYANGLQMTVGSEPDAANCREWSVRHTDHDGYSRDQLISLVKEYIDELRQSGRTSFDMNRRINPEDVGGWILMIS